MLAACEASFLMTYDFSQEIAGLVREYGFQAVVVMMKNTHHNRLPELVITRENLFA